VGGGRAAQMEAENIISEKETKTINSEFCPQIKSKVYPCFLLFDGHHVSREGDIFACCQLSTGNFGDLEIGNVENSLHNLFNSDKARELWRKNMNGELHKLAPCNTCNAWKARPNIWWRNPFYPLFGTKWF
jgi:radical SAM protein with 4Fe4S-binding SPASM domain